MSTYVLKGSNNLEFEQIMGANEGIMRNNLGYACGNVTTIL